VKERPHGRIPHLAPQLDDGCDADPPHRQVDPHPGPAAEHLEPQHLQKDAGEPESPHDAQDAPAPEAPAGEDMDGREGHGDQQPDGVMVQPAKQVVRFALPRERVEQPADAQAGHHRRDVERKDDGAAAVPGLADQRGGAERRRQRSAEMGDRVDWLTGARQALRHRLNDTHAREETSADRGRRLTPPPLPWPARRAGNHRISSPWRGTGTWRRSCDPGTSYPPHPKNARSAVRERRRGPPRAPGRHLTGEQSAASLSGQRPKMAGPA
jgi:hypothetical protein